MKKGFLDKLIERLDRLDTGSLQTHFLRLAQEKGLMETILQAIQEGVVVLSGDGEITYFNQACTRLIGLPQDAVGQHADRILKGIEWSRLLELEEDEWSRLVSREIEVTYPEHRFISFYVVPLSAVSEEEAGAVLILRDVTHDREAEAHTLETEKLNALTLLAAGVAHEIGNPLNSLNIHMQLLQRELKHLPDEDRENLGELVEVARNEIARLDQIISQFLKAIRPSTPELKQVMLSSVLDETLAVIRKEADDRDILIETETAPDTPTCLVDTAQIKQAFFNIIRNAIQVMPQGGLLKIEVGFDDRFVSIAFADTGPGINAEDLGRIFEPYHSGRPEGTGLGLMIVQRIVRDHGGEIEVDTEPGKGTTFRMFIPREHRRTRLLNHPEQEQNHGG